MTTKNALPYLINKLNLNISKLKEDSDQGLDERIKVQKIVFLSKRMGIDFNYSFSLYLHGPYSKTLSDDYYTLTDEQVKNASPDKAIDKDWAKIEILYSRDKVWLEVAATILDIKESNKYLSWKKIISYVANIKSSILTREGKNLQYVESVFEDLKKEQFISS
jgi:uncharacterized protein YwgA